jgi:hypothetical protein
MSRNSVHSYTDSYPLHHRSAHLRISPNQRTLLPIAPQTSHCSSGKGTVPNATVERAEIDDRDLEQE